MLYRLVRSVRGWPNVDYTFADIQRQCRKFGLTVRDGYGRSRVRGARKIQVSNGAVLRRVDDSEI